MQTTNLNFRIKNYVFTRNRPVIFTWLIVNVPKSAKSKLTK